MKTVSTRMAKVSKQTQIQLPYVAHLRNYYIIITTAVKMNFTQ